MVCWISVRLAVGILLLHSLPVPVCSGIPARLHSGPVKLQERNGTAAMWVIIPLHRDIIHLLLGSTLRQPETQAPRYAKIAFHSETNAIQISLAALFQTEGQLQWATAAWLPLPDPFQWDL